MPGTPVKKEELSSFVLLFPTAFEQQCKYCCETYAYADPCIIMQS
jgi:hypothetical protein